MYDGLEPVCRAIREKQFWREGWIAVRQTLYLDSKRLTPKNYGRLASLEEVLRPAQLAQKVRSIVFPTGLSGLYLHDHEDGSTDGIKAGFQRLEAHAMGLGRAVAADQRAFGELLAELVSSDGHLWSFGRGLVEGAENPPEVWNRLSGQLAATAEGQQKLQVFWGFLNALHSENPELANVLLDDAVENEPLARWFPMLQTAVPIDEQGVVRLMHSLALGKAPMWAYRNLAFGRATDSISGQALNELVLAIAAKPDGFDPAIEILYMRIHSDEKRNQVHGPEIIDAGCELMRQLTFTKGGDREDYRLGAISEFCLVGAKGAAIVHEICEKLKESVSKYKTHAYYFDDLLEGLFRVQPTATLNGLFGGGEAAVEPGLRIINDIRWHKKNPLDIVSEGELLRWCGERPNTRYPVVAAAVTAFRRTEEAGPPQWTNVALLLLEKAPDRVEVLKQFVRQFRPMSWSGSLASIMESNTELLNGLEKDPDPAVRDFVTEAKVRLRQEIEAERRWETINDAERDERFE